MGCKLKCSLDGFEYPVSAGEGSHFELHRRPVGELEPVMLMNVIEPGTDDVSIHHLRQFVHDVPAVIGTPVRHGEGGKYIRRLLLSKHMGKHIICFVSDFTQTVVGGS